MSPDGTPSPSPADLRAALARFACQRCGQCCQGPGTVHVKPEEVEALAEALGLDAYGFTERYTRLASNRQDLELLDREDGACILLSPQGECVAHAAKPKQCRDFPFTWTVPGYERRCAGMRQALLLQHAAGEVGG